MSYTLSELEQMTRRELEQVADEILAADRRGTTRHCEMRDYLTDQQYKRRLWKEVYNIEGVADPSRSEGMVKRSYNPYLNNRTRELKLSRGELA